MIIQYISLIIMTMLGAVAAMYFKWASDSKGIKNLSKNKYFYLGLLLYLCSSTINLWVLQYLDFSIVLPSTALNYVWTLFLANHYLAEKITRKKILGIISIILGVIAVTI